MEKYLHTELINVLTDILSVRPKNLWSEYGNYTYTLEGKNKEQKQSLLQCIAGMKIGYQATC